MILSANRLILGTGNIMLLRNLREPKYFILSGVSGECVISGNGILIQKESREEENPWVTFLLEDFGLEEEIKEIGVWVKPTNDYPRYLEDGTLDNIRRLTFIPTGR